MTEREAELILAFITFYHPRRCLEWGIGGSTLAFSCCSCVSEWIGIEHNQEWIDKMTPLVGAHVKLQLAPTSTPEHHFGSARMISGYVGHPSITGKFDFIFIDGDYRWQCLKKASQILVAFPDMLAASSG